MLKIGEELRSPSSCSPPCRAAPHRMTRVRVLYSVVAAAVAIGILIVIYVLFIVIDAAPGGAFLNTSGSMEPTLKPGDRITTHLIRDATTVPDGDLIVFLF